MLVMAAVLLSGSATVADEGPPQNYRGPDHGTALAVPPSAFEGGQSRLWFHDDAWWAVMLEPADSSARVFELLPDHSWRATSALVNKDVLGLGDALAEGARLRVVSQSTAGVVFTALRYDEGAREYRPVTAEPVLVTDHQAVPGAVSIARDTTGRLWVAFMATTRVLITYSDTDGTTWSKPRAPTVQDTEVAPGASVAVVAFAGSIGVMWSDQENHQFRFAVHADGARATEWTAEVPLEGPNMVDNDISLKVAPGEQGDIVLAAVKTSQDVVDGPGNRPLLMVLVRSPDGAWTSTVAGAVADDHNSPLLLVDATSRRVYLVAQAPATGGTVYYKSASLDQVSFGPGRGSALAYGSMPLADPTGSKHPINARTGLVVLTSTPKTRIQHHAEMAITSPHAAGAVPEDDKVPPSSPGHVAAVVNGPDSVALYWSPSKDGDHWAPAADFPPVRGYVVHRDGVHVATTAYPSYDDGAVQPGGTYEYVVTAVDAAGNLSPPSQPVAVTVPDVGGLLVRDAIGWVAFAAVLATAVIALVRSQLLGR